MTGAGLIAIHDAYLAHADEASLTSLFSGVIAYAQSVTRDEDAAQRAAIRVWQNLEKYDPAKGSFSGWVRVIAEREQKRRPRATDQHTSPWEDGALHDLLGQYEPTHPRPTPNRIRELILNGPCSDLVALAASGMDIWEAGRSMGLSENQIRWEIRKIKKYIAEIQSSHAA